MYPLEHREGMPFKPIRQVDGQYEVFLELEHSVRTQIKKFINSDAFTKFDSRNDGTGNFTTCLASALGRALCYINRLVIHLKFLYDLTAFPFNIL